MNIKEIKEMIALMNENGLVELEIEKDGLKLRLKKTNGGVQQELIAIPGPEAAATQEAAAPGHAVSPTSQAKEIKSPMVGTFYRAPAPDAAPYVQEGQDIDVGQVVCIVEAMKLMNEIKSEVKGRITKILVENADPVEFGQTLFLVEPVK
jgi:acetyl-CoA carboxylase biotin carboxyl carrier protein